VSLPCLLVVDQPSTVSFPPSAAAASAAAAVSSSSSALPLRDARPVPIALVSSAALSVVVGRCQIMHADVAGEEGAGAGPPTGDRACGLLTFWREGQWRSTA